MVAAGTLEAVVVVAPCLSIFGSVVPAPCRNLGIISEQFSSNVYRLSVIVQWAVGAMVVYTRALEGDIDSAE